LTEVDSNKIPKDWGNYTRNIGGARPIHTQCGKEGGGPESKLRVAFGEAGRREKRMSGLAVGRSAAKYWARFVGAGRVASIWFGCGSVDGATIQGQLSVVRAKPLLSEQHPELTGLSARWQAVLTSSTLQQDIWQGAETGRWLARALVGI